MENSNKKSFVVKDVFFVDSPLFHLEEKIKKYIFFPNKDEIIVINENIGKLKEYQLFSSMLDMSIKTKIQPTRLTEKQYILVFYLLVVKPELGKIILNYELSGSASHCLYVYSKSYSELIPVSIYRNFQTWNLRLVWCTLARRYNDYGHVVGTKILYF